MKIITDSDVLHDERLAYRSAVLTAYTSGQDNAFEAYQAAGYSQPHEDESDLDYVDCCADQDFEDGFLDAAVYQEIYDDVTKRSQK